MVERGDGGAIVNVSSVASSVALTDHLAYCENSQYSVCVCVCVCVCVSEWVGVCSKSNIVGTSKAGMDMATKVMALELGRHKVSFSLSKELSSW